MMASDLPRFARDLLGCCPPAGSGVNPWLFQCARVLHAFREPAEIENLLSAAAATCGRPVPVKEIRRAVDRSRAFAWRPGVQESGRTRSEPKWPQPNLARIEAITTDGLGLVDLWEASPARLDDNEERAERIIDLLFPGNPLLCVGESTERFDTLPREEWRGRLAKLPLIVPSPMSARMGHTQTGKESAHTLANTGPRRFLVIECDFSIYARDGKTETVFAALVRKMESLGCDMLDMSAAVIGHLAERAPLALAVHSGGKSLHGWFHCAGKSDESLWPFMRDAVSLGADRVTWTRSQFVRLPDGTRENGRRQTIYFCHPEVIR